MDRQTDRQIDTTAYTDRLINKQQGIKSTDKQDKVLYRKTDLIIFRLSVTQIYRQADTYTDIQTNKQRFLQTYRYINRQMDILLLADNFQVISDTDIQTVHKKTDRQINKQTDRQINKQADRYIDRQTTTYTDKRTSSNQIVKFQVISDSDSDTDGSGEEDEEDGEELEVRK